MTGWIIAACVVLLLFLLLACSVAVRFEYGEELRLRISYLFITLFTIPKREKRARPKRRKKPKRVKKRQKKTAVSAEKAEEKPVKDAADAPAPAEAEKAEKSENKSEFRAEKKSAPAESKKDSPDKKDSKDKKDKEKDEKKMTLGDIFELVKLAADSLGKPLKKLLHRTRILDFRLKIICGGEDAAKAALNFGRTNFAVGSAMGYIDTYFTLKKPEINIGVDFQSERTVTECSCVIKLSLLAALAFLLTAAGRALKYYLKNKGAAKAVSKLTAK